MGAVTSLVKRKQRKLKPCVSLEIGYPLRPSVFTNRGQYRHDRDRRGRVGSAGVLELLLSTPPLLGFCVESGTQIANRIGLLGDPLT